MLSINMVAFSFFLIGSCDAILKALEKMLVFLYFGENIYSNQCIVYFCRYYAGVKFLTLPDRLTVCKRMPRHFYEIPSLACRFLVHAFLFCKLYPM